MFYPMFRQNTPIYDGVLPGENEKALIFIPRQPCYCSRQPGKEGAENSAGISGLHHII